MDGHTTTTFSLTKCTFATTHHQDTIKMSEHPALEDFICFERSNARKAKELGNACNVGLDTYTKTITTIKGGVDKSEMAELTIIAGFMYLWEGK